MASLPLTLVAYVAALPLAAVTGLVGPVRPLSVAAVRALCGVRGDLLAEGPGLSWAARWRASAWWTLHLGVGAVVSGVSLAAPPMAVVLIVLPLSDTLRDGSRYGLGWFSTGAGPYLAPLLGSALLAGVVLCSAGAGRCWLGSRPYCSGRPRRTGWPPPRNGPPTSRCATAWPGSCTTPWATP